MTVVAGRGKSRPFQLGRRGRQVAIIAHLVSSLGWLGLDIVLLTLGIHAAMDAGERHASYLAMRLLLNTLLLPLGLLSVATGLLLMLGGPWGLRHKWVSAKLVLSVAAVAAAWLALPSRVDAAVTASLRLDTTVLFSSAYAPGWTLVIAPCVGFVLYLTATVLGVVKPGRKPTRS